MNILPKNLKKKGSITRLKSPKNKMKKRFCLSKAYEWRKRFFRRGLVAFHKIFPLEVLRILPAQAVLKPSHVPLDWHFRIEEPRRINPGSQLNETIFGYTVRLPDIEPFKGEDRPPQLTARKVTIMAIITWPISKEFSRAVACSLFSTYFFLPSHKLSLPLQFPVDRHCLIFEPRRLKPSSQINCTLCGYVVRFPTKDPFLGVLRAPQSFAVEKRSLCQDRITSHTYSEWAA